MKLLKKTSILLIFLTALSLNTKSIKAKDYFFKNKETLYNITAFTTEKDTLNLIINEIFKENDTLFIDAYFLNTTESTVFNTLEDFNISVCDKNNKEVLNKTFKTINIPEGLSPKQGRRILFPIEKDFFTLKKIDLSKLSYKVSFDYI